MQKLTFRSTKIVYYGPHPCTNCGQPVVRMGQDFGGNAFDQPNEPIYPNAEWHPHVCNPKNQPVETTVVESIYKVLSNNGGEWIIAKADEPTLLWSAKGWVREAGDFIINFPSETEALVYAQQQPALHPNHTPKPSPWSEWPTEHLLRKIAMPEGFVAELRKRLKLDSVRAENAEAEIRRLNTQN
jgi:hypothetical protein